MKHPDKIPAEGEQERPRLARHISIALAVKFAALALLWYFLVMPNRVEVDSLAMGSRLTPDAPQSNVKEHKDDRSDRR